MIPIPRALRNAFHYKSAIFAEFLFPSKSAHVSRIVSHEPAGSVVKIREGNPMRNVQWLGAAILVACGLGSESNETKAQGIHFGAGPVHVDIGNPHGGWYRGNYGGYHGHYDRHSTYHQGHWGGSHYWHDTSHWDYHPGSFVRHRNHYHYVPGHYDLHRDGHWHHDH